VSKVPQLYPSIKFISLFCSQNEVGSTAFLKGIYSQLSVRLKNAFRIFLCTYGTIGGLMKFVDNSDSLRTNN
jgi:hypothetical protein